MQIISFSAFLLQCTPCSSGGQCNGCSELLTGCNTLHWDIIVLGHTRNRHVIHRYCSLFFFFLNFHWEKYQLLELRSKQHWSCSFSPFHEAFLWLVKTLLIWFLGVVCGKKTNAQWKGALFQFRVTEFKNSFSSISNGKTLTNTAVKKLLQNKCTKIKAFTC